MQGYFEGSLKTAYFYSGVIAVLAVVMGILLHINYNTLYTVTFKECKELRVEIANRLKALPLAYFTSTIFPTFRKPLWLMLRLWNMP